MICASLSWMATTPSTIKIIMSPFYKLVFSVKLELLDLEDSSFSDILCVRQEYCMGNLLMYLRDAPHNLRRCEI